MGGDDLGQDDFEYLNEPVRESAQEKLVEQLTKRKRQDSDDETQKEKKQKVVLSEFCNTKALIESGRNLDEKSTSVQATFLSTCMKHHLPPSKNDDDDDDKTRNDDSPLLLLQAHHFSSSSPSLSSLLERLKSVVSVKKLKQWKVKHSPMVLIVCLSARRAVALLKELACLRIPIAKLFAKHMNVDQQIQLLEQRPFALAVGTPNRLNVLMETQQQQDDAPLHLGKTKILLLDSHASQKGFTVCTQPDTGSDTALLLSNHALVQLKRRNDFKLAIF